MNKSSKESERQTVFDGVLHDRFTVRRLCEAMGMTPQGIRPGKLQVHKPFIRLPTFDQRTPSDRRAVQYNSVLDVSAWLHFYRSRRQDSKLQKRRCELLEVACLAKERKSLGPLLINDLFSFQPI